jgi:hypothetical protein
MRPRRSSRTLARWALAPLAVAAALAPTLAAAGCGSSSATPPGLVVAGPGVQTSQPPWKPEYAHLPERLKAIGIPPGGKETFHIHSLLHIYVNGLLVPLPKDIGIDAAHHLLSSLHTHDSSGVIHMEAPHRFNFTLGDFFAVWGVKLGPDQVGGLKGLGGDHLHFLINGRTLRNPAAYVMHNHDSIVIGYGAPNSFPHTPSTYPLVEVDKGLLGCSGRKGKKAHSCMPTFTTPTQTTQTSKSS